MSKTAKKKTQYKCPQCGWSFSSEKLLEGFRVPAHSVVDVHENAAKCKGAFSSVFSTNLDTSGIELGDDDD